MNTLPEIIAVDGGGTKCRLAAETPTRRHVLEVGSANVSSDPDGAVAELLKGLHHLANELGVSLKELCDVPAYFGLAGVIGPEKASEITKRLPLTRLRVEEDTAPALRGGLDAQDGAIAHCGTGSFIGLQQAENMRFAGGWGHVLGDEASAQWVGRRAIAETLDAADGLQDHTELTCALLDRFATPERLFAFAMNASPSEFGSLAPLVTQTAETGDEIARRILTQGARELATRLTQLGWTPDLPLLLTGGIGPVYRPYLPQEMQDACIAPKGTPLDGAIALARAFRDEINT